MDPTLYGHPAVLADALRVRNPDYHSGVDTAGKMPAFTKSPGPVTETK
jgi:hypothetical protein